MSGIIGGAGSKSGIIGETELDYEEGEWTPTKVATYGFTDGTEVLTGKYIKIGTLVYLSFVLDWDTTETPEIVDRWRIGNIPFLSVVASNTGPLSGHGSFIQPGSWSSNSNIQGVAQIEQDEIFGHVVEISTSAEQYGADPGGFLYGAVSYQTSVT